MIFKLFFVLTLAGYCGVSLLLGAYMIRYTSASSLNLGFLFMVQPFTIFMRPLICARADRYQSHKKLLFVCLLITSLSYIPFIIVPFLLKTPSYSAFLTERLCFWLFVVSHFIGSFGFCGVRSLGDALAVNYAKRVGSDFTQYRKFGSASYGLCGYCLGLINENWYLPDYVPAMVAYSVCMFITMVLVYIWPEEYFVIIQEHSAHDSISAKPGPELPTGRELALRLGKKIQAIILFRSSNKQIELAENNNGPNNRTSIKPFQVEARKMDDSQATDGRQVAGSSGRKLSVKQQLMIFQLLLRRDIRITLFLLLLVYGGLVGYAPQNFVFTYMNELCHQRNTCDGAKLSGMVMLSYCTMETICYLVLSALRKHLNHTIVLAATMASLSVHYYFYGFVINSVSPYFFLIESLHGVEYSGSLSSSVELGFKFANEVQYLISELIERGIVSADEDHDLVRVSLMATISGCFTLAYDGVGSIAGAFLYGIIADKYSFTTIWIVVGSLASIGFIVITLAAVIGKFIKLKTPESMHAQNFVGAPNAEQEHL